MEMFISILYSWALERKKKKYAVAAVSLITDAHQSCASHISGPFFSRNKIGINFMSEVFLGSFLLESKIAKTYDIHDYLNLNVFSIFKQMLFDLTESFKNMSITFEDNKH